MKKSFVPWSQDEASTSTAYSAVMRHDKLLVLKTGSDCRYNFCVCPALINNSPDDTWARYHWAKAEQVNSRHPAKYWKKVKNPGTVHGDGTLGTRRKKKKFFVASTRTIVIGAKINRWGEYFRPSHLYTQILTLVLGTKALQIWRVSAGTKQTSWSVPSSITMFIVKRRLWLFFANINRVIGSTTFSKHVFYE